MANQIPSEKKPPKSKRARIAPKPKKASATGIKKPFAFDPKTRQGQNVLIGIGILLLVIVGVLYWLTGQSAPSQKTTLPSPPATLPLDVQTQAPPETVEMHAPPEVDQAPDLVNVDAILQAPIPQDDALIKEELDRLAQEAVLLSEQERLLNEQIADLDQITSKKDAQIRLLEAQIAQLQQGASQ